MGVCICVSAAVLEVNLRVIGNAVNVPESTLKDRMSTIANLTCKRKIILLACRLTKICSPNSGRTEYQWIRR